MARRFNALVTGAGGFIGGHLVRSLLDQGLSVRAVDIAPVPCWSQVHSGATNHEIDLSSPDGAMAAVSGSETVYHLASEPTGKGSADRMVGVLADTHVLVAARENNVDRFLYASTTGIQIDGSGATRAAGPAWQKLFGERMAAQFRSDFGLETRVARLGGAYGEFLRPVEGCVPIADICRRVALAQEHRRLDVEIPYLPRSVTSSVYIEDILLGLQLITHGTDPSPADIADPAPMDIAAMVKIVLDVAGARLHPVFTSPDRESAETTDGTNGTNGTDGSNPSAASWQVGSGGHAFTDPLAAAGARADGDWTPSIPLRAGVERTYRWMRDDVRRGQHARAESTMLTPFDGLALRRFERARLQAATSGDVGRHRYPNAG